MYKDNWSSSLGILSKARAWPIVKSTADLPSSFSSDLLLSFCKSRIPAWIRGGNFNSRKKFVIVERPLPSLIATSCCVSPSSSIIRLHEEAISMGSKSSRCKFSTMANSNMCRSSANRTYAGISSKLAISDARNLRSPLMSSNCIPFLRTVMG